MVLISTPLNENNYLAWSRSMRITLNAKVKLGFIDRKYQKPVLGFDNYERWIKADCMVQSWILISISKDIVDVFLYTASAKELQEEFGRDLESVMVIFCTNYNERLILYLKEIKLEFNILQNLRNYGMSFNVYNHYLNVVVVLQAYDILQLF